MSESYATVTHPHTLFFVAIVLHAQAIRCFVANATKDKQIVVHQCNPRTSKHKFPQPASETCVNNIQIRKSGSRIKRFVSFRHDGPPLSSGQ
jgi:hypothetical protein